MRNIPPPPGGTPSAPSSVVMAGYVSVTYRPVPQLLVVAEGVLCALLAAVGGFPWHAYRATVWFVCSIVCCGEYCSSSCCSVWHRNPEDAMRFCFICCWRSWSVAVFTGWGYSLVFCPVCLPWRCRATAASPCNKRGFRLEDMPARVKMQRHSSNVTL